MFSDQDIHHARSVGQIKIEPFNEEMVQPSSIDLTLGDWLWVPSEPEIIDPFVELPGEFLNMRAAKAGSFDIPPMSYVLGVSYEQVELSNEVTAQLGGKSSLGRLGLAVHVTAGKIDAGFRGPITLEIANLNPRSRFRLWPGMSIGQLDFLKLDTPAKSIYNGKYRRAFRDEKPQPSMYFKNRKPS